MKARMDKQPGEFTGKHMLFIMLGFFGVIIGVNILIAAIANSSWTGLIVKNSYVASQDFNRKIANARKQSKLGWQSRLTAADGSLLFVLKDSNANPLRGLDVSARIYRPVVETQDRTVALKEGQSGHYQTAAKLKPGVWEVAILATNKSGDSYKKIFRLTLGKDPA